MAAGAGRARRATYVQRTQGKVFLLAEEKLAQDRLFSLAVSNMTVKLLVEFFRSQLVIMAPRVLKGHLSSSLLDTPRTTKHRKIKQREIKGKASYKKYLILQHALPRTTTYRRKLLREKTVDCIPNQKEREEEEDLMSWTHSIEESENAELQGCVDGITVNDIGLNIDSENNQSEPQGEKDNDSLHMQNTFDGVREEREHEHCGHTSIGQEHILNERRDDLVYPGASLTKGESLLLIMAYILRHNLSGVALQDLLTLFNEHIPGLVPATSYLFNKAYGEFGEYLPHFYCTDCESYLGPKEKAPKICSSCKAEIDLEENINAGSFFFVMNTSDQIVQVLEKSKLQAIQTTHGIVSDIECAQEYKKLKISGHIGPDDVSLLWNCDGIPVFKSNNVQVWPIQCQIIELSPKDRQQNIIVPCLWFGKSKPNMLSYLSAFVDQLKVLEEVGLTWRDSDNIQHKSRVHALICSADSIARPLLRNTKQFNGKYGCDFCLHPGGGPYVWKTPEPALRTAESHFEHAMQGTSDEAVMGVKGPTPLMELKSMNMITSFIPEYQHSVCLGVTRQITSLWFDSRHHNQDWYIGSKVSDVDKELLGIMPPVEVTRVPRSINERKFWKASEWRSFLLFYALPVLNNILKKKYVNHLFLLVFAMHTLLQDAISVKHIDVAEKALRKYVFDFERLYGTVNVSYNVHLLMHLAASVRNWGPLWATSTFPFESFNGTLLTFFNGTTHVPIQMVKRFLKWRGLSSKANAAMMNACDSVKDFFNKLQGSSSLVQKSNAFQCGVRGVGCPKRHNTSILHRKAIQCYTGMMINSGLFYDRFVCSGVLYHSYNNTSLKKRINSVAQLRDGQFCEISTLIHYSSENEVSHENAGICVLVKELKKSENNAWKDVKLKISSTFVTEVSRTNNVFAVDPLSLQRKCVMFSSMNKFFVVPLPNSIERD